MAQVTLPDAQRKRLVSIIASRGGVLSLSGRLNLLEDAGLRRFETKLNMDAYPEDFSQQLVRALQDHGTDENTAQPALVALLRLVREKVKGHEAERVFIDDLLAPYPLATATGGRIQSTAAVTASVAPSRGTSRDRGSSSESPIEVADSVTMTQSTGNALTGRPMLFVSYRRINWPFTGRLVNDLRSRIAADIFVDYEKIDEANFEQSILRNLRKSDAVLLVVSESTFDHVCIHNSDDWIRREIALALTLNKPIVLAGIDRHLPPPSAELPDDIRLISKMQATQFYPEYWDAALKRLVELLTRVMPSVSFDQVANPPPRFPASQDALPPQAQGPLVSELTVDQAEQSYSDGDYDKAIFLLQELQAGGFASKSERIDELLDLAMRERDAKERRRAASGAYEDVAILARQKMKRVEATVAWARFCEDYPDFHDDPAGVRALLDVANSATADGDTSNNTVFDHAYHTYQSPRGTAELGREKFNDVLAKYLQCIAQSHGLVSLYVPRFKNAQDYTRPLSRVFVPPTLQRVESHPSATSVSYDEPDGISPNNNSPTVQYLLLFDRTVIVGRAGSGKSCLLAYIASQLARAALGDDDPPFGLSKIELGNLVPLVVPLRGLPQYLSALEHKPRGTLIDFIDFTLRQQCPLIDDACDFFPRLLRGGGCLLMLDGLDELVNSEDASNARQQIQGLANTAIDGEQRNRLFVTTREAGYRGNARFDESFVRIHISDLATEQITALAGNWSREVFTIGDDTSRGEQLSEAITQINVDRVQQDLPRLVDTPLTATIIIGMSVGDSRRPFEFDRAELYRDYADSILRGLYLPADKSREELVSAGGQWQSQRLWLSILAMRMHDVKEGVFSVKEEFVAKALSDLNAKQRRRFLETVKQRGGILEYLDNQYRFIHPNLQEYLSAYYLAQDRTLPDLAEQVIDPWWREVLLLVYGCARIDSGPFASAYLDRLCDLDSSIPDLRLAGVELAAAAVTEFEYTNNYDNRMKRTRDTLVRTIEDRSTVASVAMRVKSGQTLARLGDTRPGLVVAHVRSVRVPALTLCEVPGGHVVIGADAGKGGNKDEKPNGIDIPTFYIAQYPVTRRHFEIFVSDGGYKTKRWWTEAGKWWLENGERREPRYWRDEILSLPNQPVVGVTWFEALAYSRWLDDRIRNNARDLQGTPAGAIASLLGTGNWRLRLPSEAEWEKAAGWEPQTQMMRRYAWDDDWRADACNADRAVGHPCGVGLFPANVSPCGARDMTGNIWEWTLSVHRPYPYAKFRKHREDITVPGKRVLRGGSCIDGPAVARVSNRGHWGKPDSSWGKPDYYANNVGFRVVVVPKDWD